MVARLRVGYEDNETLYACDAFAASARLFDVNLVLFAFFNRFLEWAISESSPFKTHTSHLAQFGTASYGRKRSGGLKNGC